MIPTAFQQQQTCEDDVLPQKIIGFDISTFNIVLFAYFLIVLLCIAVITPPWQNADEPSHMSRAVQIAHGGIIGWRMPGGNRYWGITGGFSDPAIDDANSFFLRVAMHPENRVNATAIVASDMVMWRSHLEYTSNQNVVQYGPILYIPEATSYWFGRAFGLSVNHTLLLARVVNSLLFAAVTSVALSIARRARHPLMAILFLPTSLALGAAASQDSLLLACTALVVALLDRAIDQFRPPTKNESLLLAIILTCLGMARPPYACFLLLLWTTGPGQTRIRLKLTLAAGVTVLCWCLAVVLFVSVRVNGGDMHRQIALLVADPGRIPNILIETISVFGADCAEQVVGVLGWGDNRMPTMLMAADAAVLSLALLAGTQGHPRLLWQPVAAGLCATISILILQYLTWTPPGSNVIFGLLGRYFLPIIMILLLALPRTRFRLRAASKCAIALQATVTPPIIFHSILVRYYLQ